MTSTRAGFTLIEIILSLVVLGVAASVIATISRTNAVNVASPLVRLRTTTDLVAILNTIHADYRASYENDLQGLSVRVSSLSNYAGGLDVSAYSGSCQEVGPDDPSNPTAFSAADADGSWSYMTCTVQENGGGQSMTELFSKVSS